MEYTYTKKNLFEIQSQLGILYFGIPWWLNGKEFAFQCRGSGFDSWVGKIPWRRARQSIPVFLLGKSHGQRSLVGYSLWSHKKTQT